MLPHTFTIKILLLFICEPNWTQVRRFYIIDSTPMNYQSRLSYSHDLAAVAFAMSFAPCCFSEIEKSIHFLAGNGCDIKGCGHYKIRSLKVPPVCDAAPVWQWDSRFQILSKGLIVTPQSLTAFLSSYWWNITQNQCWVWFVSHLSILLATSWLRRGPTKKPASSYDQSGIDVSPNYSFKYVHHAILIADKIENYCKISNVGLLYVQIVRNHIQMHNSPTMHFGSWRLKRKIVIICFRHVGGNVTHSLIWVYFSQGKIMELKILIFQQLEHMAILHGLVRVAE